MSSVARRYYDRGRQSLDTGDLETAQESLRAALDLAPSFGNARVAYAVAVAKAGDGPRARADVRRSLHVGRHADRRVGESEEFSTEGSRRLPGGRDSRGQERKNDTHASKTDPDSRLYRKSNSAESRLAYLGHLLIENRHGLIAGAMASGRVRRTGSGDA